MGLTSRDKFVAESHELVCHGLRVPEHLLLVGLELRLLCLLQGAGQARDGVIVRSTLHGSLLSMTNSM